MRDLLEGLKRRKTVQWGLAYLATAWLLTEVMDVVGGRFGWSDVLIRAAIVILAFGFPATLILAWYHGEKGRQRVTPAEVALLSLVVVAAVLTVGMQQPEPATAVAESVRGPTLAPSERRLAILPLEDLSPEAVRDEYLARALHAAIISQVSKVSSLEVVASTSVMSFAEVEGRDLREIGEALGVWYVAVANVRRVGEQMRMAIQLVDIRTDQYVWSEEYDRPFTADGVLEVERDVAFRVAEALEAYLAPAERSRIEGSGTSDDLAFELYLRGLHRVQGYASANTGEANQLFAQAVELDPSFADAWSALAQTYVAMGNYFLMDPEEAWQQVEITSKRALQLDPMAADPWVSLGWMHLNRREWVELDAAMARADEVAPSNYLASYLRAYALQARGDTEGAVEAGWVVLALDPLAGGSVRAAARMLHMNRQFEEAVELFHRALEVDPEGTGAHLYMAFSLEQLGRVDEAVDELILAALGEGRDAGTARGLRTAFAAGGMAGAWRVWLDWRLEAAPPRPGPVAIGYARLGQADEAFTWLHRAEEVKDSWMFQLFDPIWDPIRGDSRFEALLERNAGVPR